MMTKSVKEIIPYTVSKIQNKICYFPTKGQAARLQTFKGNQTEILTLTLEMSVFSSVRNICFTFYFYA